MKGVQARTLQAHQHIPGFLNALAVVETEEEEAENPESL